MYNEHNGFSVVLALSQLRDELSIKNMMESLNEISYTEEERRLIEEAIKAHNLMSAKMALDKVTNGVESFDEVKYEHILKPEKK